MPNSIARVVTFFADTSLNIEEEYDMLVVPDEDYDSLSDLDSEYGDVSSDDESSISRECLSEGFCFSVYGGYALDFSDPPEIIVWTNSEDDPPPDNVELKSGEGTTTWGKGRILW